MLEEVARQSRPLSRSPDTEDIRKIFMLEYFVNEEEHLAEYSHIVSGEHEARRGGTTDSVIEQIS